MEVVWGLIGVLVGAGIASGYSFWELWRSELGKGVVATHALEDEMRALVDELTFAVTTGRRPAIDVAPAMAVWRDQREAVVLYVDSTLFTRLGAGVLASERWARDDARGKKRPRLEADDLAVVNEVIALLDSARSTLRCLGAVLREEHDRFIVSSLLRGIWRSVPRRGGPLPMKEAPSEARACSKGKR
jgi:hypothetical protein